MQYLNGLNEEQKQAVLHIEGPLLIVAGAGTGKTKTVTHRIYHLIQSGVDPRSILAITFTNKAAAEMLERIRAMHTDNDVQPLMKTFHSLGVYLLRRHADVLGYSKWFTILDSADSLAMVKRAMEIRDINPKQWDPKRIRNIISNQKGNAVSHLNFAGSTNNETGTIVAEVWTHYEEQLKKASAFDFDDLLVKSYELLRDHKQIRDLYQNRWKYVHIDEYQDTNEIQYKFAKLLTNEACNICVVGDGDQNIYSWRGANVKNILNFEKDFPGARSITLSKNYRSTKTILSAADEVIRKNKKRIDKELVTDNEQGSHIALYTAFSENDEAAWVAGKAADLIKFGASPRDIAILFRTNFQSRVMEEAFMQRQIPYQVLGVKFFDRKEVKDVVAYLRAALNPESLPDVARTINEPKRGLGDASVAKIFSGQLDQLSPAIRKKYADYQNVLTEIAEYSRVHTPAETIKFVMRVSGYEDMLKQGSADDIERLENLKELVTFASRYDMVAVDPDLGDPMLQVLQAMLEDVALMSDQDKMKDGEGGMNAVRLMTIHASKGLEFKYVFIVGLEQGLFPSDIGGSEARDDEEERRLMYVAITRAKQNLYLSHAQIRRIFGEQRIQEPSEFLHDIPHDLLEIDGFGDKGEPTKTVYLDW